MAACVQPLCVIPDHGTAPAGCNRGGGQRWRENIAELCATLTDDPVAIAGVVAASDGLCTAILLDNGPADPEHLRAVLQRALHNRPSRRAAFWPV
ncbi:TetR family transcriptional regulator C-terminal domain-containing protein [Micromonospora sp. NPDC003197]